MIPQRTQILAFFSFSPKKKIFELGILKKEFAIFRKDGKIGSKKWPIFNGLNEPPCVCYLRRYEIRDDLCTNPIYPLL